MSWRGKMAEQATAIEKAQEQSKIANAKIENDAKERIKVIYKNATIVKQYIDREVVKYDETCKIPDVVVKAHNAAAKNEAIK
jgi:DNA-binding protein YbaB